MIGIGEDGGSNAAIGEEDMQVHPIERVVTVGGDRAGWMAAPGRRSPVTQAARFGKVMRPGPVHSRMSCAPHFDTMRDAAFLRERALADGVTGIEGRIVAMTMDDGRSGQVYCSVFQSDDAATAQYTRPMIRAVEDVRDATDRRRQPDLPGVAAMPSHAAFHSHPSRKEATA